MTRQQRWEKRHPEKRREATRRWRKANPERYRELNRRAYEKRRAQRAANKRTPPAPSE